MSITIVVTAFGLSWVINHVQLTEVSLLIADFLSKPGDTPYERMRIENACRSIFSARFLVQTFQLGTAKVWNEALKHFRPEGVALNGHATRQRSSTVGARADVHL